jgi:hypothetical protein
MSALIAVCGSTSVHVLTDAASVWSGSGIVANIGSKQFLTSVPRCVIGTTGIMEPCAMFAHLAEARRVDFDGLVAAADELWAEARQVVASELGVDFAVVLGGWSASRNRAELYAIDGKENRLSGDLAAFAMGPTDASAAVTNAFVSRFADDPDSFDADRDGIALMQDLRGYRRQFGASAHPCVGGWMQHSEAGRTSGTSRIICLWPEDRVGKAIGPAEMEEAA